jgi:hypothetical protein
MSIEMLIWEIVKAILAIIVGYYAIVFAFVVVVILLSVIGFAVFNFFSK